VLRSVFNRKEPAVNDPKRHIDNFARFVALRIFVYSVFTCISDTFRYITNQQAAITDGLVIDADHLPLFRWLPYPWQSQSEADTAFEQNLVALASEAGHWRIAYDKDGREYYWNTLTRRTTWTKPRDFTFGR
jgi:hypothetical protein